MDWWMSDPCVNSLRSTYVWTRPPGAPTYRTGDISVSPCWWPWGRMINEDVWAQIDHQIIGKSIWRNAVINLVLLSPSLRLLSYEPSHGSACFHFKPAFPFPSCLSWSELTTGEEPKPMALKKTSWTSFDNYNVLLLFLLIFTRMWCDSIRVSAILSQLLPARLVEMS